MIKCLRPKNWLPYQLLAFAVLLYFMHGIVQLYFCNNQQFMPYLIISSLSCLIIGYFTICLFGEGQMIVVCTLIVMINTFYNTHFDGINNIEFLFTLVLTFGIMEFCWMLPTFYILAQYVLVFFYLGILAYFKLPAGEFKLEVIIPLSLFFIWKSVNTYMQHKAYQIQVQEEKNQAFNATVVGMKHEFNNVSHIILATLDLITAKGGSPELFSKLKAALTRFSSSLNSFSASSTFKDEKYTGNERFVNISRDD